ncbi:MAG: hypothetical protein SFY92_11740, partial [Verrucomicrobiae bacterium]|nr:hypothetical protein [Verrucomicrobiae bacterium]
MIQTSRLLLLMAILTLTSFSPCFLNALPLQSDHTELVSVPSATPPKIDGNLDDWDLSGEMFVYPARSIRERYSARMYSMYDKDYLYIGVKWRDPSPMVNNVDADGAPGDGWMADCLQMRLITD